MPHYEVVSPIKIKKMKFINIKKVLLQGVQIVAFLAIALFSSTTLNAQEVSLKVLKSDNMFIGVENLVQVSVPGIPSEKIFIGSDGVDIEKLDDGIFKLGFHYPGKTTLTVHGEGFKYKNFDFEVKRIPDPLAALTFEDGLVLTNGEMTPEEFKKAFGLGLDAGGYKGELSIEIVSYNLVRVPKEGDPSEVPVKSANFNEMAKSLVNSAISGDRFYFEQVMAKVDGTQNLRQMNSLVFHIK
jgi:GldM C-terminal domain